MKLLFTYFVVLFGGYGVGDALLSEPDSMMHSMELDTIARAPKTEATSPTEANSQRCPSPAGESSDCQSKGGGDGYTVATCANKMKQLGGDTFNYRKESSSCYVKKCGSTDMKYSKKNGGYEVFSIYCEASMSPQKKSCPPGYLLKAGILAGYPTCPNTAIPGWCILPKNEAKSFCDKKKDCDGVSETSNKAWFKQGTGIQDMVQAGKSPIEANMEWETCVKVQPTA